MHGSAWCGIISYVHLPDSLTKLQTARGSPVFPHKTSVEGYLFVRLPCSALVRFIIAYFVCTTAFPQKEAMICRCMIDRPRQVMLPSTAVGSCTDFDQSRFALESLKDCATMLVRID